VHWLGPHEDHVRRLREAPFLKTALPPSLPLCHPCPLSVAPCHISTVLCVQTLNLTDTAGTVFLNGHISFLAADLVAGNSTVGPESGLSLLSDLVGIAIQDFALPDMNRVRRRGGGH
jgi:hypothetical protein